MPVSLALAELLYKPSGLGPARYNKGCGRQLRSIRRRALRSAPARPRLLRSPHQLGQAAALAYRGGNATGMETRCENAGRFKPFPQLASKEDVIELRPSVGPEGAPIVRLSKLAKGEPVATMCLRSNSDDPRRSRSFEAIEQQICQQERRKMLTAKVSSNPSSENRYFGDINPALLTSRSSRLWAARISSARRRTSARREKSASAIATRSEPERSVTKRRRFRPGAVATAHNDPHPGPGEAQRCIEPDPGARSGDNSGLLGCRETARHGDTVLSITSARLRGRIVAPLPRAARGVDPVAHRRQIWCASQAWATTALSSPGPDRGRSARDHVADLVAREPTRLDQLFGIDRDLLGQRLGESPSSASRETATVARRDSGRARNGCRIPRGPRGGPHPPTSRLVP